MPANSTKNGIELFETTYEHSDQCKTKMLSLLTDEKFTDFSIKSGGKSLRCHKNVLYSTCDYFSSMLDSGLKESQQNEVEMDTIRPEVLKIIIHYLYGDKVQVSFEDFQDYFDACEMLQLTDLKTELEVFAVKKITTENCIGWLHFAGQYALQQIEKTARDIMQGNLSEVSSCEEFKSLRLEQLIDYLSDYDIKVASYDEILIAAIEWVQHDLAGRKDSMYDILRLLDVDKCSTGYLRALTKNDKGLCANVRVMNIICDVTFRRLMKLSNAITILGGMDKQSGTKNLDCWTVSTNSKAWKFETFLKIPSSYIGNSACPVVCLPDGLAIINNKGMKNKKFTMESMKWTDLPETPGNATYFSAIYCGDSIYVLGGQDEASSQCKTVRHLDLATNQWYADPDMINRHKWPIATASNYHIYVVVNGMFAINRPFTLEVHTKGSPEWRLKSSPHSRNTSGACLASSVDALYLVGGSDRICEMYSIISDTWTVLQRPQLVHRFGAAMMYGDKVLLCGGHNNDVTHNHIEEYDVRKCEWTVLDLKMPKPLRFHTVGSLKA